MITRHNAPMQWTEPAGTIPVIREPALRRLGPPTGRDDARLGGQDRARRRRTAARCRHEGGGRQRGGADQADEDAAVAARDEGGG